MRTIGKLAAGRFLAQTICEYLANADDFSGALCVLLAEGTSGQYPPTCNLLQLGFALEAIGVGDDAPDAARAVPDRIIALANSLLAAQR